MRIIYTLILIIFPLITGLPYAQEQNPKMDILSEKAKKTALEAPPKTFYDFELHYNSFLTTITSPVLPNLIVFVFTSSFALGLLDPIPPNKLPVCYVGVDTVTGTVKILKQSCFNDFVDTFDIARITNETEALDYIKFIMKVVYNKQILDNSPDIGTRFTVKYLTKVFRKPESEYMPKIKTKPEGYWGIVYVSSTSSLNLSSFSLSKWLLCIEKNGKLLDVGKQNITMPVSVSIKVKLSDSLIVRKLLESPLPPCPKGLEEIMMVSESLKLQVKIDSIGKIIGKPKVLHSIGGYSRQNWDKELIKWLKDQWIWEKSSSETNGTIEIEFSWIE